MSYLRRAVDAQLDVLLPHVGAIALDGPKAVGKTATASRRSDVVLRLDREEDRGILAADPDFQACARGTALIDEWQKMPVSWDLVRRNVDENSGMTFLLTGSATPVSGIDTHSGAGRILSTRMRPMAIFERAGAHSTVSMRALLAGGAEIHGETTWTLPDYAEAIVQSGFPAIYPLPAVVRNEHLDSYITRILDRDLPAQGYTVRDKRGLLAWLAAYAAASSTTTGYSEILDAATPADADKPAKSTTQYYRQKLAEIWVLDPVPAWDFARSPLGNLARAPKHQLADPALAARLVGASASSLTTGRARHLAGPLFESLATLSVRVAAEAAFASVGHLRRYRGDREIDLIVEGQDGQIIPVEVKLAAGIDDDDVRHLLWLREQLPDEVVDMVILSTGRRAYRRPDGVAVIPLALLGA